ncbi:MAG: MarR family winged helix-turn-helix transcriptional regulator [Candidatus Thorarchaeota archaeon]|jgi:DNA-binding MarR family transcriptional regulator
MNQQKQGGFLITKIHHLGARVFSKKLKEHGIEIGPGQGRVIFSLWQEDGIPISELAKRTALGKSTLTDLIDRLMESDFVRREPHPSDRRVTLIHLTDSAREIQDRYNLVSKEMTDLFYRGFLVNEIDDLETYLQRLLTNLEDTDSE